MEEFLAAPVKKANPKVVVIESAKGIDKLLEYQEEHEHGDHHQEKKQEPRQAEHEKNAHAERDDRHGEDEHGHHHEGVNPHLFASPRMTGLLAMNIAGELSKVTPEAAAIYLKNAQAYMARMDKLAEEFAALGKTVKNNRIVTQHGVFDYLARDMGLEVVAVMQAHEGQEPSASEMLEIVRVVKDKKAGALFTEPQYPQKVGRTIAKEAGIPSAILDPVATGPEKAGLDYYEVVMRQNMEVLRKTLGQK
jgi:ABC-type Zn uptake system ZnuABC Zn-binding protein ZnuA